jgi:hypothetical protein
MSKYRAIVEQLRVESNNKYQGEIESSLRQIESQGKQDDFTDTYLKLQREGEPIRLSSRLYEGRTLNLLGR